MRAGWRTSGLGLGGLLVASLLLASTAGAQDAQDPYGPTTTTTVTGPVRVATIQLTINVGPDGVQVGVFACGYLPSESGGSITFDGSSLADGLVAGADGCLALGGAAAGRSALLAARLALQEQSQAPLTVLIPAGSAVGEHAVCSVVAGYNTPCTTYRVTAEQPRDDPDGGSLPTTGIYVALLVAIALALLVGGRTLLEAERRRRRQQAREAQAQGRQHASSGPSPRGPAT